MTIQCWRQIWPIIWCAKECLFAQSHELVGRVVKRSEELGVSLGEMATAEYHDIDGNFSQDVFEVFSVRRSVEARDARGGTATAAVCAQIARARECLV